MHETLKESLRKRSDRQHPIKSIQPAILFRQVCISQRRQLI
ncbi:hypothetical protein [Fortiea sp. LEGE XX443]|nr:hypothetical protein [Fortiea sp. LEGE XX443]